MTRTLCVFAWAPEYDTSTKRRRKKQRLGDVARDWAQNGSHPAMAARDYSDFVAVLEKEFGTDREEWPFIIRIHENLIEVEYTNVDRVEVCTRVGGLANMHGLNSVET